MTCTLCFGDHHEPCPCITGYMIATLGFACAACGVNFKPGIDFVLRLADAARPVRMKRPWGHAACCMRLLSSGGFITEANLSVAISAYEVRTQEAHARTGQATDAVTQTPEPLPPVVDEHAPIVYHSTTCERPAVIFIMAGAGSGKTTCCNSIVKANPTRADGTPATVIAVSTTRAGCKALKQMPDIPPNVVHTGHALGLRALSSKYRTSHLDGMDFDESGNLSDIDTRPKSVTKSSAKHTIMLQQMSILERFIQLIEVEITPPVGYKEGDLAAGQDGPPGAYHEGGLSQLIKEVSMPDVELEESALPNINL